MPQGIRTIVVEKNKDNQSVEMFTYDKQLKAAWYHPDIMPKPHKESDYVEKTYKAGEHVTITSFNSVIFDEKLKKRIRFFVKKDAVKMVKMYSVSIAGQQLWK